ncbi:MAG TPA: head GIN domain-containing protein [Puia sp.]|nr:head GIN domain-containing protein [Puia sp.]
MRLLFTILLSGLIGITVRAQKTIIHDPYAQLRSVKGFHGIEVSDAINLYLSQGDTETVVVSASDPKWRDRIRTEVIDGILHISLEHGHFSLGNTKLKAYVSFTTLNRLDASGASDIFVDGVITGNELSLTLSGASDFRGAINVKALDMNQSGASDAHITGVVSGMAKIESSGASDVKGYDLVTDNCDVHASGASDIRVTVKKELTADATGASSIYYKGDATIRNLRSSGASTVKKSS